SSTSRSSLHTNHRRDISPLILREELPHRRYHFLFSTPPMLAEHLFKMDPISIRSSPDISHWRGLRVFRRSAVSRRFRGTRDRRGLWRLVRMAMFPALWKVRRKAAAYAAALVN